MMRALGRACDTHGSIAVVNTRWVGAISRAVLVMMTLAGVVGSWRSSAQAACRTTEIATLPLSLKGGHFRVTAAINGHGVDLVVDTGAAVSALDRKAADRLQIAVDADRSSTIVGVGGTGRPVATRLARTLTLGALRLENIRFVSGSFGSSPARPEPIAGILGADILFRYDVEFDPARHAMILHRPEGCSGRFLDWGAYDAVPLQRFYDGSLKRVPVAIDGVSMLALLDTGATGTVLFRPAVRRLGPAAAPAKTDRRGLGVGSVAGKTIPMFTHRFASLMVGRDILRSPDLTVANDATMELEMLLGLDYLGTRRIWISYATDQLFIASGTTAAP
ncbi:retropepsin-like aspartic protease [Lichenihabitans psoromatis]|uniref:retropepsin-like aspartic protease n=1 Tax=Lichenihabitans psoromatis TaxID=2528642 RepID=UPI0013F15F46|nr:retropepsin-like aspartic protease [Lichenihabitans psoromatis]